MIFVILFFLFIGYSILVYTVGTDVDSTIMNSTAVNGKLLFQKHNCISCHQLYGLGGYLGPELTTVISTPGKGELFAFAIIQSGTKRMPVFHLNKNEVTELVEYLKCVDATAVTYKKLN